VTVVVLSIVGIAGFTWFAYWPFEGRVDDLATLVPADVEFVYRASWADLRDRGWLREHLVDRPVHPSLERFADFREDSGIARIEAQVDGGLPGPVRFLRRVFYGTDTFSVEKDLVAGDVIAAGKWCGGGSPSQGPPRWREVLLLTRVTGQVKFGFEAMKHEAVRNRALPPDADVALEVTPEKWLRVELKDPRLRPRGRREGCEGGAEMGPIDVWYVARVKDVLAVSNSEDLVRGAVAAAGGMDRAMDRPGFSMPEPEGGVAAFVDIERLRSYLQRFFATNEGSATVGSFLGKFVAIDSLDRATIRLAPSSSVDGLVAQATVQYSASRLRDFKEVTATYELDPKPVAQGIASLVPAADTVAVVQVTTPPAALFHAIYDRVSKDDRKLFEQRVREIGAERRRRGEKGYEKVGDFLDELAAQLTANTGLAVSRIPSAMDAAKYESWYYGAEPAPTFAVTVLVGIPPGKKPEDVDAFMAEHVAALGFDPPERVPYKGVTYARLKIRIPTEGESEGSLKPADLQLIEPAYYVSPSGWLVLSSREDYLLKILPILRGDPDATVPLSRTPAFRSATQEIPADATLALFVDGSEFRKLLWDYRNKIVREKHPDDQYAIQFRAKLHEEAARTGRAADLAAINDAVDKEMERYRRDEYARFVRDWRRELDTWSGFGAFSVAMAARRADSQLELGSTLLLSR
jgi:hypothetical protein